MNRAHILDTDKTTRLYSLKFRMIKPHMIIESVSTGATVATVVYHSLSSRIDTTLHGHPVTLTSAGLLKSKYTWSSPALGGATMTWNAKSFTGLDLDCLDEQGILIARYLFSNWSMTKCGTLELLGPRATHGPVTEELLVTGLALVVYVLTLRYKPIVSALT
ncbi:MAG: hypothetical protein Q9181_008144 [Wetmoreana brouardii]